MHIAMKELLHMFHHSVNSVDNEIRINTNKKMFRVGRKNKGRSGKRKHTIYLGLILLLYSVPVADNQACVLARGCRGAAVVYQGLHKREGSEWQGRPHLGRQRVAGIPRRARAHTQGGRWVDIGLSRFYKLSFQCYIFTPFVRTILSKLFHMHLHIRQNIKARNAQNQCQELKLQN